MAWLVEQVQRPTLVLAPNKTLAAQLYSRVQRVLPAQRRRVLRQLLRLLPARSLYRALRHLYREGLDAQRGDREAAPLGHALALRAPRRADRGLGLVHLRPRLARGLRADGGASCDAARRTGATKCCACSPTILYERNDMDFSRGKFRVRGDVLEIYPSYEELAVRVEFFGDEIERIRQIDPLTGELLGDARPHRHLSRPPLHHDPGEAAARHRRHRGGVARAAARAGGRGQDPGGGAPEAAHQLRPGDAARDGYLLGYRELLAPPGRPRAGLAPLDAARLLPRRLPAAGRRVAHRHPAGPRHVRRRPLAQRGAGRLRLPPALGAGQPAAALRRVRGPHQAGRLRLGHAGTVRVRALRAGGRADHPPDRPARPHYRGPPDRGPDRLPAGERAPARRQAASAC